jgi:four helix bundle protein
MEKQPPAQRFEDLMVWQKAHELVLHTYQQTADYPKSELYGLVSQMRRAAVSVPANIAEAFGRTELGDKSRFLGISQGSLQELRYFYILSRDLKYSDQPGPVQPFDEIAKMLGSYSATIKNRRNQKRNS